MSNEIEKRMDAMSMYDHLHALISVERHHGEQMLYAVINGALEHSADGWEVQTDLDIFKNSLDLKATVKWIHDKSVEHSEDAFPQTSTEIINDIVNATQAFHAAVLARKAAENAINQITISY
jgi:hypothetical protein